MEKTDIAIAAAGAIVLVVAIAGSAVFGGTGFRSGAEFSVTFPPMTMDLEPQTAERTGGGEQTFTFDVAVSNLTQIVFTPTVTGPAGGPTNPTSSIVVTAPNGTTYESADGVVTVSVQEPPAPTTVSAPSADQVALPAPTSAGQGTWTVSVAVSSPGPLPVPYTVTVAATLTHYEASVAPKLPETTR